MPFKRRFKDKYAGSLPERICCPNSVRLVVRKHRFWFWIQFKVSSEPARQLTVKSLPYCLLTCWKWFSNAQRTRTFSVLDSSLMTIFLGYFHPHLISVFLITRFSFFLAVKWPISPSFNHRISALIRFFLPVFIFNPILVCFSSFTRVLSIHAVSRVLHVFSLSQRDGWKPRHRKLDLTGSV